MVTTLTEPPYQYVAELVRAYTIRRISESIYGCEQPCHATHVVASEAGRLRLICTLDIDHDGQHYDDVYHQGWER